MFCVLAAVVLGTVVQRATSQPAVLRASGVEILDGAGRVRITLRVFPNGAPGLVFNDTQGISRAIMSSEPAALMLNSGNGYADIMLAVFPDGKPELSLRDAMHNACIGLGVSQTSNGRHSCCRMERGNTFPGTVTVGTADGQESRRIASDSVGVEQYGVATSLQYVAWLPTTVAAAFCLLLGLTKGLSWTPQLKA